jgi:hypothetical protein
MSLLRRIFVFAFAVAALATLPAPASAAPTDLLFVQQSSGGEVIRTGPDRYKVRLHRVSSGVTTFADRPSRTAGHESLKTFVSRWKSRGFAADAPNAALVIDAAPASSDVTLLTLSRPKYDRGSSTLTYSARPLKGEAPGALADFGKRGDRVRARRFGAASLFIDDSGSATGYKQLTLQVANSAQAPVQVVVAPLDPSSGIEFSIGPPFTGSSGVDFVSTAYLALYGFSLRPTVVTWIPSTFAHEYTGFTAHIWLVADNVEKFTLRVQGGHQPYGDPQVRAALDGAQFQVVGSDPTTFTWNP